MTQLCVSNGVSHTEEDTIRVY